MVSARLVDAAPGASNSAMCDLCEFEVEVNGSGGHRYDVRLRAGFLTAAMLPATCSCPDFVQRGNGPCKHIGAAWCCAVNGNFGELVALSRAAGRREVAERALVPRAAPAGGDGSGLTRALRDLRWAEAEIAGLRDEARQLRAQAATAALGKATVDFLPALETLHEWERACRAAESYVYVACFTFDQPAVAEALVRARMRGLTVNLMYSGKDKQLTYNQAPKLQRLRSSGCGVRAHQGNRQHAKVLMTEREMILGSCNFTTASQGNIERGVLLQDLAEEVLLAQKQWFEGLFDAAIPFMEGIGRAVPPSPAR